MKVLKLDPTNETDIFILSISEGLSISLQATSDEVYAFNF